MSDGVRALATGLGFVEGPALGPDGRLRLVSITGACLHVLGADGTVEETIPVGGGPNGLVLSGGAMFVAQNGGVFGAPAPAAPGVQVIRDGAVTTPFDHPFGAPNDLCFGPDGRLYVTDPVSPRALHEPVPGRVIACDPATGRSEVVIEDRNFPNGIAFDATGEHLYLARTFDRVVERFTLRDGALTSDGVLCRIAETRPDGIAVDTEGRLWVCTPGSGGLEVFEADGRPVRRIEFGAGTMTTNLCFGPPGSGLLYVTAAGTGTVLAVPVEAEGLPLRG